MQHTHSCIQQTSTAHVLAHKHGTHAVRNAAHTCSARCAAHTCSAPCVGEALIKEPAHVCVPQPVPGAVPVCRAVAVLVVPPMVLGPLNRITLKRKGTTVSQKVLKPLQAQTQNGRTGTAASATGERLRRSGVTAS